MEPSPPTRARLPDELHALLAPLLEAELDLPVLPDATARLLALCQDEAADARRVEAALERDPSLAGHILRVANSAAHAPREPIVSLQQAVGRLGLAALRGIVIGAALEQRVFRVPGHEPRVRAIWRHCAVAAAFAREIARKLRRNVEAAFLCGLLHDVGRPIVLQALLATPAARRSPPEAELLEAAMDQFHATVAARLVRAWKLAEWTSVVVAHHHEPERAEPYEEQAHVTLVADHLAHWAVDEASSPAEFACPAASLDALNLYPEDVDELLAARARALEFAEVFR